MEKLSSLAISMQRGDDLAFEKIYTQTSRGVFAFIYSMVRNYHVAEDLMQDTFVKVKLNIDKFKPKTNFRAWLFQIAKNHTLNYINKENRVTNLDEEGYKNVVDEHSDFSTPTIDAVMEHLKPEESKIVIMYVVSGFKHREIAEILDMPLGTVTWTYNNAIKKMKEFLK